MRKTVWFAIHIVGCLCGVALAIYGFHEWKAGGFPLRTEDQPPSTSGNGALGISFIGLSLFAYCVFEIVTTARRYNDDTPDI